MWTLKNTLSLRFSETLALAVVVSKGIPPLKDALINEPEDHLKATLQQSFQRFERAEHDSNSFQVLLKCF